MKPRDVVFARWLKTRPEAIRRLAARFPPESTFELEGKILYLIGYSEAEEPGQEGLIVSPVDPKADYEGAMAAKIYLCADCLPPPE